jgi:hypothetical protein
VDTDFTSLEDDDTLLTRIAALYTYDLGRPNLDDSLRADFTWLSVDDEPGPLE